MDHRLLAAAVLLAAGVVPAAAKAQQPDVVQVTCQGNEPFWHFEAGAGEALLSQLTADGTAATPFRGALTRLGYLEPPWTMWRGIGADGQTIVAALRAEQCLDTMAEATPPFDHRVVLSLPGEGALVGCCRVLAATDPATVPIAVPEAKAPTDWSRFILDFLPAIRRCIADGPAPVEVVLKAWPMNRGFIGVRLRGIDGRRRDCIATHVGDDVDQTRLVSNVDDLLPGEGDPTFYLGRRAPLLPAAGRLERVIDAGGVLQGWLFDTTP